MTYAGFLAIFLGIPILLVAAATWIDFRRGSRLPERMHNMPAWIPVAVHIIVALAYTTPWDNYLVATGVWYYNPSLVTGITLGWVPIEEYTFFVLQTLLTGMWLLWMARRVGPSRGTIPDSNRLRRSATLVLGAFWLVVVVLLLSGWKPGTYLSLILVWAIPPIMLQFGYGADILWRYRRLVALAIGSMTLYLSLTDSLAINSGTWTIAPDQSFHILLGGVLPLEEFFFFLVTNTLIVFGITLLMAAESRQRARAIFQAKFFRTFIGKREENFS